MLKTTALMEHNTLSPHRRLTSRCISNGQANRCDGIYIPSLRVTVTRIVEFLASHEILPGGECQPGRGPAKSYRYSYPIIALGRRPIDVDAKQSSAQKMQDV